jgi:benzil reductase ((S)-benzoin forming)
MNYFFITGASKGLGKSLRDLLLEDESNIVYGLSRTCSLRHERYFHSQIDLSNLNDVQNFHFPLIENTSKLVLINNAGIVGDINHVGNLDNQKVIDCYNVNLIAPVILTNNFISFYSSVECDKMILNVSSGAGRSPIDGWNVYCSTKSGLDMFSEVLNEEVKINGSNFRVLSLAPGIIDTDMQGEIRNSEKSRFSNIQKFKDYKDSGSLVSPLITAKQVLRFIDEDSLGGDVVCSVRDLTE